MPEETQQTDLLDTAAKFVNSTASHIFLTGKAGTGKTTFLRELALKTHKSFVIIAPTGIAALNAKGVTIHSQFLFPLGSFIPEREPTGNFAESHNFFTQHTLAKKHPLNNVRKQVLRAADLVIIDEVSMLRADLLDAIDYRMRSVKGNFNRSFGGAQLLMIGDLFQLPPIVKDHEWSVLKHYYRTMHFFEAKALQQDGMVYIELDKIFRQQDNTFINVLNNLRNNVATAEDINLLNRYYKREENIATEGVITITTHNYKADAINKLKLEELPGSTEYFDADVNGDFPEKIFPLPESIGLKVGAQVMFIKNDSSGENKYFNGKLARVDEIDDDKVTVIMAGSNIAYTLVKERWENKKYTINENSKELEDEVVGTFLQYPVKLAWAVTVHKSQGLTFDKAIIDVGQAFAPGQVYVALSRLRSLDGLILRTKINASAISSDSEVVNFSKVKEAEKEALPGILKNQQLNYLQRVLAGTFDFAAITNLLGNFKSNKAGKMEFQDASMQSAISIIQQNFKKEIENTAKFRNQLLYLLYNNSLEKLVERIEKGSQYYSSIIETNLKLLYTHISEVEQFSKTKMYLEGLDELDQMLIKTLGEIEKAAYVTTCIIEGKEIYKQDVLDEKRTQRRMKWLSEARKMAKENPKVVKGKTGRKRKIGTRSAGSGSTYKTTYALLKEGMSIKEIALIRNTAESTIEGHAVKGVKEGELNASDVLAKDVLEIISNAFANGNPSLAKVYEALDKKYTFDALRIVRAQLQRDQPENYD